MMAALKGDLSQLKAVRCGDSELASAAAPDGKFETMSSYTGSPLRSLLAPPEPLPEPLDDPHVVQQEQTKLQSTSRMDNCKSQTSDGTLPTKLLFVCVEGEEIRNNSNNSHCRTDYITYQKQLTQSRHSSKFGRNCTRKVVAGESEQLQRIHGGNLWWQGTHKSIVGHVKLP